MQVEEVKTLEGLQEYAAKLQLTDTAMIVIVLWLLKESTDHLRYALEDVENRLDTICSVLESKKG